MTRPARQWLFLFILGVLWVPDAPAQSPHRLTAALQAAAPEQPLKAAIGIHVDQITSVDQKAENFGAVATLRVEWNDPKLGFDPEALGNNFRTYSLAAFTEFVDENAILVPGFLIYNQQGRRFSQEQGITVFADGHAVYFERFTVTLQAPDFDFVRYPLDTQKFYIHIDSLLPTSYVVFEEIEGYSGLGDTLGEEAWVFDRTWTEFSEVTGPVGQPVSRFTLAFSAHRHLDYYVLRIFIPLVIIILVSWGTFFLKDFGKRIDIGSGNLLVFVAFNFTISDNLPRLGYITFLDAILVVAFVLTGLVVVINVVFRRLEVTGREIAARKIDAYTIWGYPTSLAGLVLICWYLFEWVPAHS